MTTSNLFKRTAILVVASCIAMAPPSASAQIWIGQIVGQILANQRNATVERACMSGDPVAPREVEETKPSAFASIRGYWNSVSNGEPAAVQQHFLHSGKARWVYGEQVLAIKPSTKIADPFAQPGASLSGEPSRYLRSGDGTTVRAQWQVLGPDQKLVGTYDAHFRRSSGMWQLLELNLIDSAHYVEPLLQYCHKPGDVMVYRVNYTAAAAQYHAKRASKMAVKAQKLRMAAEKATGAKRIEAMAKAEAAEQSARYAADTADFERSQNQLALAEIKAAEEERAAATARLKMESGG